MKILNIGPSPERARGGMATVIKGIRDDRLLNEKFNIEFFTSFIDGAKILRMLYSIVAMIRFRFVYRKYDLFHIHVASYTSTFRKLLYMKFLKKRGKKVILHIHGGSYIEFYNSLKEEKRLKLVESLNSADMVIALSEDWKSKFESCMGLEKCVVLNNGININELSTACSDVIENREYFLMLARMCSKKGVYDLIDAVELVKKEIPDVHVFLAGDGEIEKVRTLIKNKKLQKNIEVVGWIDSSEKISLLKKVATVILPSYHEGLPMSILEGMAAGKAIVSTRVGAIPTVVHPDNGILIEAGNVDELANAIKKCINSPEMLQSMSKKNRRKIEQYYSEEKMHRLLAEYYTEILKK